MVALYDDGPHVLLIDPPGGMIVRLGPQLDSHGTTGLRFIHTGAAICQLIQLTSDELLLRSTAVPCEGGVGGS